MFQIRLKLINDNLFLIVIIKICFLKYFFLFFVTTNTTQINEEAKRRIGKTYIFNDCRSLKHHLKCRNYHSIHQ